MTDLPPLRLIGYPTGAEMPDRRLYLQGRHLADHGQLAATRKHLDGVESREAMSATDAALLSDLLRLVDAEDAADRLSARLASALDAAITDPPEDPHATADAGNALLWSNRIAEAEPLLRRAAEARPTDLMIVLPLASALTNLGRQSEVGDVLAPAIDGALAGDVDISPAQLVMIGARMLAYFEKAAEALDLLDRYAPRFDPEPAEFAYVRQLVATHDQSDRIDARTLEKWETFSTTYDQNLSMIGSKGPLVLKRALSLLPIKPDGTRTVLDAGCGTGLNAWQLAPYAKTLYGCDLSIGMLKQAQERGFYDFVVRTDLTFPATYPDATFDLILLADVLLYMGDLRPIMASLARHMAPGAWIVLTIEDGSATGTGLGWEKHAASRFRHSEAHLTEALTGAGLSKPKLRLAAPIRFENSIPVPSLTLAAQKPALAF